MKNFRIDRSWAALMASVILGFCSFGILENSFRYNQLPGYAFGFLGLLGAAAMVVLVESYSFDFKNRLIQVKKGFCRFSKPHTLPFSEVTSLEIVSPGPKNTNLIRTTKVIVNHQMAKVLPIIARDSAQHAKTKEFGHDLAKELGCQVILTES